MRILVCGSRHWNRYWVIKRALEAFPAGTIVIQGEAKGADIIARTAALTLGFAVESYPAQWARYGRAAGPIRNQQMLDEGKPDLVLAFHADIENSKGTADMVKRARKGGVEVRVFTASGVP